MNTSAKPATLCVTFFFIAVIALSIVLALLIVILPADIFLALSNYLQIIAAIAGALVLLWLWHRSGKKHLLWAGAGFGLWGLANIAWYVSALLGFRSQVFPGIIDIGLILGLILIAVALWTGLSQERSSPLTRLAILVVSLVVPGWMIVTAGFSLPAFFTLLYFVASGLLIAGGLDITKGENPLLMPGTILLGISFMIYPLREIYLVADPIMAVIGPLVSAGFALILLGLLPFSEPAPAGA